MLGGRFLFPLFVDPEDAAAADAREILHTVASYANPKSESFNPQRLATIIRSTNTNKRSLVSEMTEIDADVLNSLPKWAQAVVQTGCLNGEVNVPAKRSLELQQKPERGRSHKRRSVENKKCGTLLPIESDELRTCRDDLNAEPEENSGIEDEEKLAMLFTQAEIIADSVGKCAESLKKLVGIAMIRQQEEVLKENDIDVFKPDEVKMLAQTLKAMRRNEWIDKLDPELLISLMNMLDIHVKSGLAIDMMGMVLPTEAEDQSEHKNGFVGRLVVAIEVAMCELTVMTTPRIDQRVLSDEIIDNCFQLLYRLIRQMLLPCFDTAYVTTVSVPANTANTNNRRQSIERRMYRSSRINLRAHKSISKTIDRVFHLVCEYMDQLASLVSSVKLSDRWILSLSSSMIELLALDHSTYVTSLQQSALANLRGIFLKYEHHRESVLGDIVEVMLKLPTAKRTLRTVKLLNSANFVQRISTIVVSLIQTIASARIPKLEDDEFGMRSASDGALLKPFSKKSSQKIDSVECILVDTQRYARIFVRKLLQACWKKTDERDYLVVFENFVEDLLVMFVRPEWIGAEYLLEALTSSMASILHATISKVAKNPDLSKSLSALNIVGKICVSIRQYQKKVEQSMMDEDSDSIAIIEEHTNYLRKVMTGEIRTSEGAFSRENCSLFHELALKHITLMHLQRNGQADSKNLMIAKFVSESSCHWSEVDSACEKQERSLWESLWEVPMRSIESTLKVSAPTHELALKASMYLAVKREFCGLFNSLLAHVMGLLSKGIPSLRARVIKCLRMIVDVDPMVMAETGVHVAVQRCSSDARPLVREAAMELIGTYVLLQPLLVRQVWQCS
ncbi:hypothetical protein PsorP6_003873 [Peronosclerospora sorghi]|uniref:Uncharacterized protein n=1 Tax=Peronosclerospora sorghi TaxID=230839 RepID=A0ACC0VK23_9STRA|nr:hypothetical protein PsorP6_003873 [Peronosclerospora sorghi]